MPLAQSISRMENKNNIQNEQEEIGSPVFGIIDNSNVFTVPEGYFDELPVSVLGKVVVQNNELPDGYFDELPLSVLGKIQFEAEVPEGYFEALPIEVLGKINSISEQQTLPTGYFDNLSAVVMQRIKADETEVNVHTEMEQLSATIAGIGNKHPFTVPTGYFDNNVDVINKKITGKQPAVIVKMGTAKKILRYAVAAVVTGLMGLGIYTIAFDNQQASLNPVVMAKAENILKTNSIDDVFNSLTETDITDYMTENGSNINAALVASTINDEDLPTAEDYLFDEETLNDFLKGKNITN